MADFDYDRFLLETDFQSVLSKVKESVFLRTDFEERKQSADFNRVEKEVKLKWPGTIRESVKFPFQLFAWLVVRVMFAPSQRMIPSALDELKNRKLPEIEREWRKAEDWIVRTDVRDHILTAEVPDGLGDDPFIVAERIARPLLKDDELRSQFENDGLINRIAVAALVLADINFADYRRSADPGKWGRRSRREY
jgi:hypothetical protein